MELADSGCDSGLPVRYIPCTELVHPYDPSCLHWNAKHSLVVFKNGVQLYLPLFAVVQLATKKKLDLHNLKQVLQNVARSSLFLGPLFLSTKLGKGPIGKTIFRIQRLRAVLCAILRSFRVVLNGPGTMVAVCAASRTIGVHHPMALGPLATLVAYAAINVEKKSRRKELALYMLNLCIEALFRMGVARGYWRPVKHGLSFIFAIASAGLLGFYNSERQSLGNIKTGLDVFVGEVELPDFADRFLARSVLPNHWSQFKKWVVSGFIKMTAVGFGLRFMGVFLSIIFASSLRRRLKVLGRGLGMGARFGLFLGLFSTISRLAPSVLMKLFGLPKTAASIVSGFIAGAGSVFYPSTEMSLYMLVKLFDAIFNAAVARKKVTPIPGGDSVVFAITTGFLFYVGVFEHFCIRRRYWQFLLRMSGYRLKTVPQFAPRLGEEYGIPQARFF